MTDLTNAVQELKTYRENDQPLQRGKSPHLNSSTEISGIVEAILSTLLGGIVGSVAWGIYQKSFEAAWAGGKLGASLALIAYAAWPALTWIWQAVKILRWPGPQFFTRFPTGQNFFCLMLFAWP